MRVLFSLQISSFSLCSKYGQILYLWELASSLGNKCSYMLGSSTLVSSSQQRKILDVHLGPGHRQSRRQAESQLLFRSGMRHGGRDQKMTLASRGWQEGWLPEALRHNFLYLLAVTHSSLYSTNVMPHQLHLCPVSDDFQTKINAIHGLQDDGHSETPWPLICLFPSWG